MYLPGREQGGLLVKKVEIWRMFRKGNAYCAKEKCRVRTALFSFPEIRTPDVLSGTQKAKTALLCLW